LNWEIKIALRLIAQLYYSHVCAQRRFTCKFDSLFVFLSYRFAYLSPLTQTSLQLQTNKTTPQVASVEPVPESPTTARPLEMDDDDVQESGVLTGGTDDTTTKSTNAPAIGAATSATANSSSPASGEVPPPKPPRPSTETQRNEQILKEAFPSIDMPIIKAVLTASRGQIEPAFNALLEMTDPEAARDDDNPPPPPPRPVAQPVGPTTTAQSPLEADEMYARRLAEHFENVGAYEARTSNNMNNRRSPNSHHGMPRGRQQTGLKPNELHDDDREHSFLDDDLPVIKEQLRKGFLETQTKVNSWITTLKKKIDETFDEEEEERRRQQGEAGSSSFMGRPSRDHQSRRSAEYDRYDADPELLSDDFAGMKFRNDGSESKPMPPFCTLPPETNNPRPC